MKLDTDLIGFIESVLRTAQSVSIDNVIIEEGVVRAIDDGRSVVIYQNEDVPDLPFGSIGLNRVGVLLSRLEIAKTRDGFSFEVVSDDDDYARAIVMKGTGTKIDYRCSNPATIQAPKQINDTLAYSVELNAEAVSLLQKGHSAMGSETMTIASSEGTVSFELTDVNSDKFKHIFTDSVTILEDAPDDEFSHKYPVKTILALFKQNPDGTFEVGSKGILSITVNGLDIYVLPQV